MTLACKVVAWMVCVVVLTTSLFEVYGMVTVVSTALSLQESLQEAFKALGIGSELRGRSMELIAPMKRLHEPTWRHLIAVGVLAMKIGQLCDADCQALFLGGLWHDIGKLDVPIHLLGKKDWTPQDEALMRPHAMHSYRRILGKFGTEFYLVAEVVARHHRFQSNKYPDSFLSSPTFSNEESGYIEKHAPLLAMADAYHAMHRLATRPVNGEHIKDMLLDRHSSHRDLIVRLYKAGIFTICAHEVIM